MLTNFLTSKSRSRNAKVRARRSTLESLETRQMLNGSLPNRTFGSALVNKYHDLGIHIH